jgi:hypothetical protein
MVDGGEDQEAGRGNRIIGQDVDRPPEVYDEPDVYEDQPDVYEDEPDVVAIDRPDRQWRVALGLVTALVILALVGGAILISRTGTSPKKATSGPASAQDCRPVNRLLPRPC